MPKQTRDQLIDGAVRLLATSGLQGASLGEVLKLTGAPRGSLYHHFPGGKDQLVAAALALTGDRARAWIDGFRGRPPEDVAAGFLDLWRQLLTRTSFRAGCGVLAVTVAATDGPLLEAAAEVFRSWRTALVDALVDTGISQEAAKRYVVQLLAATEGAVVLSRAERDIEPFEIVAEAMLDQARALPR